MKKKTVKNSFYADTSKTSFGLSLTIHAALLCAIFLRIAFIEQEKIKKKELLQKMLQPKALHSEPVLLYYVPPSMSGSKNPTAQPTASASTNRSLRSAEDDIKKKNNDALAKPVQKEVALEKDVKQKNVQKTEPAKKVKTEVPSLISIPKEPTKAEVKALETLKKIDDAHEIRTRKLTLADLFKTMPHLTEKEAQKSEGPGSQLVMAQGDMRYYTIIKKNIDHMNQVFGFHGGQAQMMKWAQQGLIKRNVGISIILDRKGNVLQTMITSSGYKPFDELTKKTVLQASPFPPISEKFKHKTFRLELTSAL